MKLGLLAILFAKMFMSTEQYPTETNHLDESNSYGLSAEINEAINLPANINQGYNINQLDYVLSREKREPKAAARGGRGGGMSSRGGGRSYRGSSYRGGRSWSYRSNYRTYSRNRPSYKTTKNYFTGKKWYNLNGKSINLYKNLLYTKSGKIKQFITTTKGVKYKINKVNKWLNIKTKDKFTISTFPRVTQYKYNNHIYKLAACNFYFNYLWHNPLEMHLLYHKTNNPVKLLMMPNREDETMIDVGYYDTTEHEPTSLVNDTIAVNQTLPVTQRSNTFIKLASIPKGNNIGFAILNKESANKVTNPITNPVKIYNTTTTENKTSILDYEATPLPYNNTEIHTQQLQTLPHIINPNDTDISSMPMLTPLPHIINPNDTNISRLQNITMPANISFNTTISYDANNITAINSLLDHLNIADEKSQLVIISDNKVITAISLPQKVENFLIRSNNDTIFTYSMDGFKTEKKKNNNIGSWNWNSATTINEPTRSCYINYMLLATLALLGMK